MANPITHIKNPLTIIAVFAGLAEVSGTVVLPLLKENIQQIYVWFLMFFPCLIVVLFFLILFFRHHALYAPSDFRDENIFASLFVSGTPTQRLEKLTAEVNFLTGESEIAAEAAEAAADVANQAAEAAGEPSAGPGNDDTGEETEESAAPAETASEDISQAASKSEVYAKVALAEDLVILKIERDLGLKFRRNVKQSGSQGAMVDALSVDSNKPVIIETKLLARSRDLYLAVERAANIIMSFSAQLPTEVRSNIKGVIAIVAEGQENDDLIRMEGLADEYAKRMAPNVEVKVYGLENLQTELLAGR